MTRTLHTLARGSLCVVLFTGCWLGPPVRGGVGVDVDVDLYPPAWFLATAIPFYFDGHPSYWYGNQWYYRDGGGGGWRSYASEPGALHSARMSRGVGRQFYGRGRVSNGGFRGGGRRH